MAQGRNRLIIVESPTKAVTIGKIVGSDYKIIASKGHVRGLPKLELGIDVDHDYTPKYEIDESKKNVIKQIKDALKGADELILATDEDREGESISWHLLEVLKPRIPYSRMVFHEITKKAILSSFEHPRDIDMNLVHAQEARRILDRLYGYTISPVLWSKLSNKTLSAGRVQSPGLRLIVDREKLRLNFKQSEFRDLRATFKEGFSADLQSVNGKRICSGKDFDKQTGELKDSEKVLLLDEKKANELLNVFETASYKITEIKEEPGIRKPAPPFMTSTLQQEGNRKLKFSAEKTMRVAQLLYEQGFITYMRTDSLFLSDEGLEGARNAVISLYGSEFLNEKVRLYATSDKNAQEAHEAIRPAGEFYRLPEETGLSGDELSLYTLIFKRTLACQMKDAVTLKTEVSVEAVKGNDKAVFTCEGTQIKSPGYIKVYEEGSDPDDEKRENQNLPILKNNQALNLSKLEVMKHLTREPFRFTEATLIKELESRGIGRPSTYSAIIDKILEKKYVIRKNGQLIPTFTGFGIIQMMDCFEDYIDYNFTRDMETQLDKIAEGKKNELEYLRDFYEGSNGLVSWVQRVKSEVKPAQVKKIVLPQLSDSNSVYLGKFGCYVMDGDRFVSVPESLLPCDATDAVIEDLKQTKHERTENPVVGTTSDGSPIYYGTGKFGDYWQINDKYYTVPFSLKGKDVPSERIEAFFNLPRNLGKDASGNEITANLGKYGPYLKCNNEYRKLKTIDEVFTVTNSEASEMFSKAVKKESAIIVSFPDKDGNKIDIRSGRYGNYIKFGKKNIALPDKYKNDSEACKSITEDQVLKFVSEAEG